MCELICDDNQFKVIKELKEYIIEATNIETSPDEMKVLDDICFRLWQLGLTLETKRKLKELQNDIKLNETQIDDLTLEVANYKHALEEKNEIIMDLKLKNKELETTLLEYKAQENLYWNTATNNVNLREENDKLKKAIEILKDYLNLEVELETMTIITDVGDTSIVGATKDDAEDLMLLKEVLE